MKRLLPIFLILCLLLPSCAPSERRLTQTYLTYFDTVTTVTGYESDEDVFAANCAQIEALLEKYHRLYDIYYRYDGLNNLCVINASRGETVFVPEEILDLLELGRDMYRLTDGHCNIAMGAVLSLWHDAREATGAGQPTVPTDEALQNAALHCNIDDIVIDRQNGTVTLRDPDLRIDVGSLAKGYAAQKITEWLRQQGLTHYAVNLGGNVCTAGDRPDGQPWSVAIRDPDDENVSIDVIPISAGCLVTSGDYQRYFTVDGVRYSHIIDPDTLTCPRAFRSVSVIGTDSALCDALSTALFCMTYEAGNALVRNLGLRAVWVTADGSVLRSE